ncbi:MAG: TonB-dependent receptor [Saccharospirillum sp.]|uniref:TonB-dependent receptor n=1 Tax=Saccharospirillum sp. TaxID=2033801 RepID=UPI003299D0F0
MKQLDRSFLLSGLVYGTLGMCLGLYMAASHIHVQHVTHAHIMLVGFLLSVIYAIIHKLWLPGSATSLSQWQFILHHLGTLGMLSGLFFMYQGLVPPETLEPVLAFSSTVVLVSLIMMGVLVVLSGKPFRGAMSETGV